MIAAGEVVLRPSSVVRTTESNRCQASVVHKDFGMNEIVIDDGIGMNLKCQTPVSPCNIKTIQ